MDQQYIFLDEQFLYDILFMADFYMCHFGSYGRYS